MKIPRAALITFVIAASTLPVGAHHSFAAEFDASKAVRITGVISKVEWTNPHSYLYVDVKDDQGNTATWACEGGAPNALSRRGFRHNDIKLGDTVTIDGYGAKDGSHLLDARRITLSDGRSFYSGSPGDGGPGDSGKSQ
ncbi:MAG: hypothetical protein JOZ32_06285 [Bryobacterales bacterium]|nr:hypothetical protein [Bryobacterales bacterium]